MSFHFSHIQEYHRFIALDIGSYRVRASVYDVSSWELKELSFASIRQDRKNMIEGSIADLRSVALTIERAIIEACREIESIPEDIILSFSSKISLSDTITTQYIRADETVPVTMNEIDTMIKRIEAESFDRMREKAQKEYGIAHDDIRLISSTITAISIDGKNYTNPLGSTGVNIRFTILNIFTPAADYNILRSVVASLWKRIISLIPTPLVFSKVLEKSEYIGNNICSIDLGYYHTTMIIESKNAIVAFETFPFGFSDLILMFSASHNDLSPLQIEKMMHEFNETSDNRDDLEEFSLYIVHVFSAFVKKFFPEKIISHILLHGWIFENKVFKEIFSQKLSGAYGRKLSFIEKTEIGTSTARESLVPYWLAIMAHELLLVKKDPLVRILRYVLYNYD